MTPQYKMEPHSPKGLIVGKAYCVKCGLVYLNNDFTRWAIRVGCNNEEHPDYKRMRAKTGDF